MSESIFSDQWYKLSGLHPFLRPTVIVERQWVRGELWYLLTPTTGSATYRLNKTAYSFIGRCNGKKTIQSIWDDLLAAEPEATLTQHEVIELLITVQSKGFVEFEKTADARQLLEDIATERRRETRQKLNPLAFKVKLGNPQRWLSKFDWLAPIIFSSVGMCFFSLVLAVGLFNLIEEYQALEQYAAQWLATPRLILLVWLVYPFIKLVHETAHALAVLRWGGRVQEVGVSLMLLFPVPYVDASDASRFTRPYQRALVGAAGIFAELTLAVFGLLLWRFSQPGWIHDLGFVIAFTGGVSTLLFNGNPLIKMDAYFVLADVIQMPNLAQRSQAFFKHCVQKFLLGMKGLKPSSRRPGELLWLAFYSPVAWVYRVMISIWMVMWIGEFSPTAGYAMALFGVCTLLLLPLIKSVWYLKKDLPAGAGSGYWQTQARAFVLFAVVVGLIGFAPLPERRIITGVVWMPDKAQIKTLGEGFVDKVLTVNGQTIVAGDGAVQLGDPTAKAQLQRLRAKQEGLQAAVTQTMMSDLAKSRQYQLELEQLNRQIAVESEKLSDLVARADAAGKVFVKDAADIQGRFFKRGELVGYVMPGADAPLDLRPIVRVAVEQDDVALLKGRVQSVELQLAGDGKTAYQSNLLRDTPAALGKLPSAALGDRAGGDLTTDPQDKDGLKTARPTFAFDVSLPPSAILNSGFVGQKAFVRFDLGASPLAAQWLRRAQQTMLLKFAPKDI
jgi:putative peptide zinc metalloprotease protein